MSNDKSELDTILESMTNDQLESVAAKIGNIIRERDPSAADPETPLSKLVGFLQASETGTAEIMVLTRFKEQVRVRVDLLDPIVRH